MERKWKEKEYHEHVDVLWVVVVSNKWDDSQYEKWNQESPKNTLVIPYYKLEQFLNGLPKSSVPIQIEPEKRRLLDALARCTYHNKEEIKKRYRDGKSLDPQTSLKEFT